MDCKDRKNYYFQQSLMITLDRKSNIKINYFLRQATRKRM